MRERLLTIAVIACICGAGIAAAWWLRYTNAPPTPEEYMARMGEGAKIIGPGELTFEGRTFSCGRRPTLLASKFSDYAAAFPGFLIVNPDRFAKLTPILQLYAYTHECGHQFVGRDEESADCFAIDSGVAKGWLDANGLEEICAFISRSPGDLRHPPGIRRCAVMRACFSRARPGREQPAT
ncbi:MAG: hypothetical protein H7X92_03790 [Chitinophagales bacterium]|nr:hypothetical protein [Hyphomicrobiales bacterium]